MKKAILLIALLLCAPAVIALSNPASGYCVAEGYKLTAKGCTFPDNKSCAEWDFMRGKCGQKYTTCVKKGFKVNTRSKKVGSANTQVGVCVFPDKKECELPEFTKGTCVYNAPVVQVSKGSRDLGQYLAEKRAARLAKPECKKEGESIPIVANPPLCCPGLKMIKPISSKTTGIKAICTTKCGNFVCDKETETKYNCPRDCKY